jgi:hypothetical protein
MRRVLLPVLLLLLLASACPGSASKPCGEGYCPSDRMCSPEGLCVPPSPRCGDGIVDPGEGCDDGDANDDAVPDACRSDCQPHRCGDGIVDTDEVTTCLSASPAQVVPLHVAGHLVAPEEEPGRVVAIVGAGPAIEIVYWTAGAPIATTLTLAEAPVAALWQGAELLVLARSGRLYEIRRADATWTVAAPVDTGVHDAFTVQSWTGNLVVASPARVVVGQVQTSGAGARTWTAGLPELVPDAPIERLRSVEGAFALLAVVAKSDARLLRTYEYAADTGWTQNERPLGPDDVLELVAGAPHPSGTRNGDVAVVRPDRVEIYGAKLESLTRMTPIAPALTWAHRSGASSLGPDLFLGQAGDELWAGRLAAFTERSVGRVTDFAAARLGGGTLASDAVLLDVDADGWPEVARRVGDELRLQGSGDGPLSPPRALALERDLDPPFARWAAPRDRVNGRFQLVRVAADLSGDWQEAQPDGSFAVSASFALPREALDASVQDLLGCDTDGDGSDELIALHRDGGRTRLTVVTRAGDVVRSFEDSHYAVVAATDLDDDGACDVVFATNSGMTLFKGRVGSGLGEAIPLAFGTAEPREMHVFGAGPHAMLTLRGTNGFFTRIAWATGEDLLADTGTWRGSYGQSYADVVAGIFADDGVPDVLTWSDERALGTWPDGLGTAPVDVHEVWLPVDLHGADLNGDGRTDLLGDNGTDLTIALGRDPGASGPWFTRQRSDAGPALDASAGFADIDGDAASDLIFDNPRDAGATLLVRHGRRSIGARAAHP